MCPTYSISAWLIAKLGQIFGADDCGLRSGDEVQVRNPYSIRVRPFPPRAPCPLRLDNDAPWTMAAGRHL